MGTDVLRVQGRIFRSWLCLLIIFMLAGLIAGTGSASAAPTVTAVTPAVDAAAVPVATTVTAVFSEPLDPATVTAGSFLLSQPVRVSAITAGYNYTLLLKDNGTVSGWGYNGSGQATVPGGLGDVIAVAAGSNHSVALKKDGTVVAWGENSHGQTTIPAGLAGVTAVAAGTNFTLALKADGTVVAWGDDSAGQINIPGGLAGVSRIAAGSSHALALKADGTVTAWGDNASGQALVPAGLAGVIAVSAGLNHSLALKADGSVVAWGANGSGQIFVPVGLGGVIAIAAGANGSVALKDNGSVVAWGDNSYGQTTIPAGLAGVVAIAAGYYHTVALKNDGAVVSWGDNSCSQTRLPAGLAGVIAVAAGASHPVALKSDGTLFAWGYNSDGQADIPAGLTGVTAAAAGFAHTLALTGTGSVTAWGRNDTGQSSVPPGLSGVIAVAAGDNHSVALKNDATVVAWGLNSAGQATVPGGLAAVTKIAAGSAHTLALQQDGSVAAWGSNVYDAVSIPLGLSGVTAIAAAGYHSLALKGDGSLTAWGDNTSGQSTVPAGLTGVSAIAAGSSHSVALKGDGTVVAWGANDNGQSAVPAGLAGVVAIAAGNGYTIAVKNDGTLVSWGDNKVGQATVPQDPYGLNMAAAVAYSSGSNSATLTPVAALPPATTLTATVNSGVRSLEGVHPAADYSWSFTTVATPVTTASPAGGTYSAPQSVTLTASEPATIYYTTNGATPTTASSVYSGPLAIVGTTALKFFARDSVGNSEVPQTAIYTIVADTTPPVTSVSPAGGSYSSPQSVTLTASEPATIYYTTNGATPSTASPVYSGSIPIPVTSVLKFFARDMAGNSETVKSAVYTINLDTIPPVTTASPPGGVYSSARSVTLTANEPATIYYTTNGAMPSTASGVYSGAIPIPVTSVLKFFARDTAGNSETVRTESYTIKQEQIITFGALAAKTYGEPNFTLSATANSGLAVSYASSNSAVAIVSGNTVTIVGAGSATITASQGGDGNYNPATAVVQALTVTKALLTVQAVNASREYGAANPAFSVSYSGFVNGDSPAVLAGSAGLSTAATASSPVGSYAITVTAGSLAAANYSFSLVNGVLTVNRANQAITFGALAARTYGDPTVILSATASSGLAVSYTSSNPAVATISGTVLTIVGAGSAVITASQGGDGAYNPAVAVGQALTVAKALLTVQATDATRVYGVENPAFSVTYSGFGNGDSPAVLAGAAGLFASATASAPVGSYAITADAGSLAAANYSFSFVNGTLTVTKAEQAIIFGALAAKTYGDPAFGLSATTGSGLPVSYTSSNSAVATVSGTTVTIVGAGTATIHASQSGDGNYHAALTAAQLLTVNKAAATVALASLSTTYDGTPKAATATTVPAGLTVTLTYNGNATAPTAVASYSVVGTVSDPNYQGSASGTLIIAKGNQTITFDALPVKTFGDPAFALVATADSGLAVTYTSSNPAVATVSGSTVTIVSAGTATITANQGGNGNYNAAAAVARTLTVNKAMATLEFGQLAFTYDGTPKPVSVTTLPVGLTLALTYDGSATAPIDVGNYTVVATVNDANYQGSATATEEISKKSQTITFGPLPVKTYGDAPFTFPASASSKLNLSFDYDPTVVSSIVKQGKDYLVTIVGAGTTVITATQAGNRNYSDAPPVSQTLIVNKAAGTVNLGSLSTTYDGSAKTATATTSPAGLGVTFTYNGSAAAPTAAGSYSVSGIINDPNYQGSVSGTLAIAKAGQAITFGPLAARTYGNAPFNPNAIASSGLAISYSSSNPAVATVNGSIITIVGIGTTTITAAQGGDGNYTAAPAMPQTLTVGKELATVTLGGLSVSYNGTARTVTVTTVPSGLPVALTYNGSVTAPLAVGTYTVAASVTDPNYEGTASGMLTVAKGAATVTLGGLSVSYSGTPQAATATTVPSGLPVTLTYNGSATLPTAAGSYTVAATVTSPNYQGSSSGTLTIAKGAQTISFDALPLKTVGNAPFSLGVTATSGLAITFTSSNPAVANISGTTVTIVTAGTAIITASQGGDTNYAAAPAVSQTLTVNAAQASGGKTAVTIGAVTSYFDTVTAALAAITPGSTANVKLQTLTFAEAVNLNLSGATVSISGGYDSGFIGAAGMTTIQGSLTISSGALIADRLVVM